MEISLRSSRAKALLADVAAFALSGFSVKLLSFFMVPLYTFFLTTEDYAIADLVSLSVQIAIPLLTLSISDSVLRFGLDRGESKEVVLGTGFAIAVLGVVAVFPISIVVAVVTGDFWLAWFAFSLYLIQGLSTYFAAFFKCNDKTKTMATISSIAGISVVVLNVVLIAVFHLGLHGYWLGNVIGNGVGLLLYLMFGGWRAFSYVRLFDRELLRNLLAYSIPLIPNALFWWINSSMDRFVLATLSTLSFVGLYSVASKIPQILNTIGGFFFQAWNISSFKEFDADDFPPFFRKGFDLLLFGSFVTAALLIVFSVPLAKLLFSGDFFEAWKLVPLLVTGAVVNILNQFLGSVFTASKQTKAIFATTAAGSVVNITLNIILVVAIGGIGAVFATLISYLTVYLMRKKMIQRDFPYLELDHSIAYTAIAFLVVLSLFAMAEMHIGFLCLTFLLMAVALLLLKFTNQRKCV